MNIANETGGEVRRDNERYDDPKSPERLEREVDEARARVGRTASELSDRLSPGELLDQAIGTVREQGGEFGRDLVAQLGSQARNNPMPLLLTSVGVGWMMMSSGNKGAVQAYDTYNYDTYGTRAGAVGHGIKEKIGDAATKSRDKAAAVGDRVHDATANMKHSAENARDFLAQFYREQPLLAGSLGLAIGAALGALVPPTELEDEMIGETRDRSVEAAKSTVARKYAEVRDEVRESASAD